MKTRLCTAWLVLVTLGILATPSFARADGCYICGPGTFVRYKGADTWGQRKKAEACGCKVQGTVSSCAGTAKVLCEVTIKRAR